MINVCTIVARNYLAYARVLAASFLAHHPGGQFRVLLIDDEEGSAGSQAADLHCYRLRDIGLSARDIVQLTAYYEVTELATAVKPPFLRFLLDSGWDHVIYLDPDIKVFDSLALAATLAREHGIVLTPHMTRPLPRDGRRIDDAHILSSGMFNLGFIALGGETGPFLEWWWSRTRRHALIEQQLQMFTDQRWIDYVPTLFGPHILRSPAYNVAYWNLHERDVAWTGGRYHVGSDPLVFFHFSGFNVDVPHLLSHHQGDRPRVLMSERPALRQLCAEYRADLIAAGVADSTRLYGWARLPSGLEYDKRMRRLYREGLEAFERGVAPEPPAPFEDEPAFIAWLKDPVAAGPWPRVSRYLYRLYLDRPDLQAAFPDLAGVDAARYFQWLPKDGVAQEHVPAILLPPLDAVVPRVNDGFASPADLQTGINLAGYFRAELGIGEAARLIRDAIGAAGVPHATFEYDQTESRKQHVYTPAGDGRVPYDVNLLCVNADRTPEFARTVGPQFFQGRRTVGYWFWELQQFPAEMHAGFDVVDEVWAATRFVTSAIDRVGRRPVYHVPLGVPVFDSARGVTRESLGLPAGFIFLFMFDFFSSMERKNPLGLIRAFKQAFREGEATLVLKSINGDRRLRELEQLRAAVADRSDILLIDRYYDVESRSALMASADCYVSLHRSEGFGLTMAEAMALGKPVIATGYSGNLDFMNPSNSYLVEYTKTSVPASGGPYACGTWAEPSDQDAAAQMRRVLEASDEAAARAARGRETILTSHSLAVSAAAITRRLDAIRGRRGSFVGDVKQPLDLSSGAEAMSAAATLVDKPDASDRVATPIARLVAPRAGAPTKGFPERLRFAARRAVEWALGPYWRQRQLNAHLVSGLRDVRSLAENVAARDPDQQRALAAVWTAVQALETGADHEQTRLAGLETAVQALGSGADHEQTRLAGLETALRDLVGAVRRQGDASTRLTNRLYAVPYMDDRARFERTLPDGRRVLGYHGRRPPSRGEDYRLFEDIFRGPESLIRERFRVYVPLLIGHGLVADLGCGRGEMLDLLREAGVCAKGVDIDAAMIGRCREKGHVATQCDALEFLAGQPDASLGAVFAAQVAEHLQHDEFRKFLCLSRAKLRPGGCFIMETVNPHCLEAFRTFWTDLTHVKPIFPEVALAWCWLSAFEQAEVLFPGGTGDLDEDRQLQGQYAVIAHRSSVASEVRQPSMAAHP
jgi:glycosyltransferase involved in cell wall biosynthesis/SAM-dependent methyltransferase